jgi:hypothetical protein
MTRSLSILKRTRLTALKVFIGLSLCVYFFFLMLPVIMPRGYDFSCTNVYLFTRLSHHPLNFKGENYEREFPIFTTRVAPQFVSGKIWDMTFSRAQKLLQQGRPVLVWWNGYAFNPLQISFGLYQTGWVALLFGLFIYYRPDAVFLMFGTFAGLMYNLTVPAGSWWLPWDMPSLCLFTWAVLVFLKGEYRPLMAVVFLASLFKETGLVCALLILFGPWSWRKRLLGFAALVLSFVICRKFLMYASGATTILLPFNEANDTASVITLGLQHVKYNLGELFSFHLNSPLFTNCGLLFMMLILPGRVALKLVAFVFVAGQIFAGNLIEFRCFYELLPLGLMQLSDFQKGEAP